MDREGGENLPTMYFLALVFSRKHLRPRRAADEEDLHLVMILYQLAGVGMMECNVDRDAETMCVVRDFWLLIFLEIRFSQ